MCLFKKQWILIRSSLYHWNHFQNMLFSLVSIGFCLVLNFVPCPASFLLDMNSEMNPIHDYSNNDLLHEYRQGFTIPKTVAKRMGIENVKQYHRSVADLKKWMNKRLNNGNKHLLLKIAKTFKQARRNKTLPRNILRKLNAKSKQKFEKMVTIENFQVMINERRWFLYFF